MDLSRIDLNLLITFEAVMKERSVTRAAAAVGLSQPAVSSALGRLRRIVGDPLLVRTSHGMLPTPRAERLMASVDEALRILRASLQAPRPFDPAASRRTFRLLVSDIGEIVYLPRLVEHVRRLGLEIKIHVLPAEAAQNAEALKSGTADLALGLFLNLRRGFEQERLFTDSFVCMVRADHPTIGNTLNLSQFLAAEHVVVMSQGVSDGIVEQTLSDMGHTRKVALRVPHFLAVPLIVARTNLLVTVPERLGKIYADMRRTRLLRLPFVMPTIEIRLYWHRRFDNDAGNRWLRSAITELFAEPRRADPHRRVHRKGRVKAEGV